MADCIRYITRPARRRQALLEMLRQQIVSGAYQPGTRIPSRRELQQQHRTSLVTVQAALDQLANDGFLLVNRGKAGTFVHESPPHLCRYALVFTIPFRHTLWWSQILEALHNEALAYRDDAKRHFVVYFIGGSDGRADQARLLEDIQAHRFAGILFAPTLETLQILATPDVPVVPMLSVCIGPGKHFIAFDPQSFMRKSLAYLAARGRRRICVMNYNGTAANQYNWQAVADEFGILIEDSYFLSVGVYNGGWMRKTLALMLRACPHDFPDGIIITDDNLVPETTEALLEFGINVPETVDVVAHGNYPWLTPSAVPCRRLGYDIHALLHQAIENMIAIRMGEPIPTLTDLCALFEEEL